MKILITGGAGFIGSHLLEELLKSDNEILVFDNYLTGKKENIEFHGNFKLIEDDFGTKNSLNLIKEFNPQICFHLAAQSSVVVSVDDPLLDFEHNILQPVQLIKTLLSTDCNKFVFTLYTVLGLQGLINCQIFDSKYPYHFSFFEQL